jgi:hypothetical protein
MDGVDTSYVLGSGIPRCLPSHTFVNPLKRHAGSCLTHLQLRIELYLLSEDSAILPYLKQHATKACRTVEKLCKNWNTKALAVQT